VDLLLSKGVANSHSLHKVFHSFAKVVPNEKIAITTGDTLPTPLGIQM